MISLIKTTSIVGYIAVEDLTTVSDLIRARTFDAFFPLLMVKDFGSEGFTESQDFMTNADVPSLATDGLIENPVNPFTGKPITMDEKLAHEQMVIVSRDVAVEDCTGKTVLPGFWASVKDDIWNEDNWVFSNEKWLWPSISFPDP